MEMSNACCTSRPLPHKSVDIKAAFLQADSLESIASIHRVEEKLMQDCVDLKEKLETGEVEQFSWLDSDNMISH